MNDFASRARLGCPKVAAIAPFCAAPSWADYPGIVVQMLGDVHAVLCCAVTELDAVAGRNPLFRRRLDLALDVGSSSIGIPPNRCVERVLFLDRQRGTMRSVRAGNHQVDVGVGQPCPCAPSRRSLESKFDVELAAAHGRELAASVAVVLGGVEGRHALVAGGADFVDSAQTFDL